MKILLAPMEGLLDFVLRDILTRVGGLDRCVSEFIRVTTSNTGTLREVNIHELQKKLNAAMMKLSEDHRTVVTLYDVQGLQHAEISKILGVSEGTVRSRLFYAHRLLQTYLEDFVK